MAFHLGVHPCVNAAVNQRKEIYNSAKLSALMYHYVANESVESGGVGICSGFLVPPSGVSSVGGLVPSLQEKGGGLDLKCDRLVFVMRGECLDFVDGIMNN